MRIMRSSGGRERRAGESWRRMFSAVFLKFSLSCRFAPVYKRTTETVRKTAHESSANPMKISRIVLAVLFALAASANTLRAVPIPTFSFHENGQGKLQLPPLFGGGVIPLPGTLMSDPGPGGLASALAFTAHPQAAPFPEGDVVLMDANGNVSDVLRFDLETTPGP